MYKIKKEYKTQKVVCNFADGSSVNLDNATQEEFEKIYKIEGYRKFIEKVIDLKKEDIEKVKNPVEKEDIADKEVITEPIIKEPKKAVKPVAKKGKKS